MNKLFIEVVQLQKKANDKAKPDWLQNPPKYLRAAWMEMAEGIDELLEVVEGKQARLSSCRYGDGRHSSLRHLRPFSDIQW